MQIQMTLKNRVREARQNRRMTQEQLAQAASVTRQTIIAIEAGKYSPSLEMAFRIADAFGVTIGEVFECAVEEGAKK